MPKSTNNNKFRRRVQIALINAGMSVTDLAHAIGRPRQTVSRTIHGTDFPRVRDEIAKYLSITP